MLTPAVSAAKLSPCIVAEAPICMETSAAEHAVLTVWHGPLKPRVYDMRPAATATLEPKNAKEANAKAGVNHDKDTGRGTNGS